MRYACCATSSCCPTASIYLDGNSLGALPRATPARVARVVEQEWGGDLITSWNRHGWIDLAQRIGDKIARLIGAEPGEVVVAESTSINLFKVLAVALKMRPGRRVIVSEAENFPTDLYMAESVAAASYRATRCGWWRQASWPRRWTIRLLC